MGDRTTASRLLIKPGTTVWISDTARAPLLGPLPDGAVLLGTPAQATVAVVVAPDAATIRAALETRLEDLASRAVLWVVYPKGNRADINRDSLWRMIAPYGLRPITQVAIDETWSALRFRPLRPDEAEIEIEAEAEAEGAG